MESGLQYIVPITGDGYDSSTLAQRVAEQFRRLIMEGKLTSDTQLPNELELSILLKVSRSTVRSALTILEQSGFVQRRWGIGTFVAKDPPTYNNLNINSGVTQLIRSSGAELGFGELVITSRPASEHVANRLSIDINSPVMILERVYLANERRVVFCIDTIPHSLLRTQSGEIPLQEVEEFLTEKQSMYTFIRERLKKDVHHGIAWIKPLTAEGFMAEKLAIPHGSSILQIEQVDFGNDSEPLALSDEYYVADAFTFNIYRAS